MITKFEINLNDDVCLTKNGEECPMLNIMYQDGSIIGVQCKYFKELINYDLGFIKRVKKCKDNEVK